MVRPDEDMTAARFIALGDAAIASVAERGKPVIVCGGTGLYVRALLLGLFEGPPASAEVRAQPSHISQSRDTRVDGCLRINRHYFAVTRCFAIFRKTS